MTASLDNDLAPGCFGSPIIFKSDGPVCSICVFADQCAPRSQVRREALQFHFGIKVKVSQAAPKSEEVEVVAPPMVSKKSDEVLGRLERAKISVTDKLARGENPFVDKPGFLRIACGHLLRIREGITRDDLCYAFTRQLNWTHETAVAHVSQAVQVLKKLDAVVEENGRIKLKRNVN